MMIAATIAAGALVVIAIAITASVATARAEQAARDRGDVARMLEEVGSLAEIVESQVDRAEAAEQALAATEKTVANVRADVQQLFDRAGVARKRNAIA